MKKTLPLLFGIVLLSACSASYRVILEPPKGELNRYSSVIVEISQRHILSIAISQGLTGVSEEA